MKYMSKKEVEQELFGENSLQEISDYHYKHFIMWCDSKEAFDEYAENPVYWSRNIATKMWFRKHGERKDLENIKLTPFDLYAPTHPNLKNKTI